VCKNISGLNRQPSLHPSILIRKSLLAYLMGLIALTGMGCATRFTPSHGYSTQPLSQENPIHATINLAFMPEKEGAACGDVFQRFARYLDDNHVFAEVSRKRFGEDPSKTLLMQAQFNCWRDFHDRYNLGVAILTGATFFLTSWIPLHDFDARVDAVLTVSHREKRIAQYDVRTHYDGDATYRDSIRSKIELDKWLSRAADDAFYRLAVKLREDRGRFETIP
jgi:hypothetical protein